MEQALKLLKAKIGIKSTIRDEFYTALLQSSAKELERKIKLDLKEIDDIMLLVDYADWINQKRDKGEPMPENIKDRIRDRKIKKRSEPNG
jgi:hypothetical protein